MSDPLFNRRVQGPPHRSICEPPKGFPTLGLLGRVGRHLRRPKHLSLLFAFRTPPSHLFPFSTLVARVFVVFYLGALAVRDSDVVQKMSLFVLFPFVLFIIVVLVNSPIVGGFVFFLFPSTILRTSSYIFSILQTVLLSRMVRCVVL